MLNGKLFLVFVAGTFLLNPASNAWAQCGPTWCTPRGSLNFAEKAICDNPTAWRLDARLNQTYQKALRADRAGNAELIRGQQTWNRDIRNACGANDECLEGAYRKRIAALTPPVPSRDTGGDTDIRVQEVKGPAGDVVAGSLSFSIGDAAQGVLRAIFEIPTAKGAIQEAIVNEDKSLIAVTNYPATKTADSYLFIRHPNGDLTAVASLNRQAAKLLKNKWADAAETHLSVISITGHIMELFAHEYGPKAGDYCFKVSVGADGILKLVDGAPPRP